MHRLVELHVGPVLYEDMTVDMPIKQVTLVETGTRVWDRSRGILAQAQLTYKDRMRIGFVWTGVKRALAAKKDRNDLILYHLHRALAAGRTVLVLAPSIAQLKYLHTGIQLPEEEKCLIIGKVEMDERHAMMQGKRVVVATDILAKQGIDYPQLDCLFLCFPMAPQQAFGRIQRGVAGKREPVVVCFTDMDNPSAANQAVKFRDNVHKLGYPVRKLSSAKSEEQ